LTGQLSTSPPALGALDDYLILVNGVSKIYSSQAGDKVSAIEDVSFAVRKGEFTVLVGPSGCGKTTVLKILGGLLKKTSGEVTLKGIPVEGPSRDVGIVFQNPVLLPWRTVLENALLPIEVLGLKKLKYLHKARELIRLVGLEGFESKYPHELSGGMQQRNALVRALILDPSLLLMDEPFGALDAMTRDYMNLELQRIWQEKRQTVFFITHSIPEAVFLADRILVMSPRPGRIIAQVDVNLPRPRDRDAISSPAATELTTRIRHLLDKAGTDQ